jgi:hypothetical protein
MPVMVFGNVDRISGGAVTLSIQIGKCSTF